MTSPLITLDRQAARAILDGLASGLPSDWSQPGARDAVGPMLGQLRTRGCLILPGIVRSLALSPERGDEYDQQADGYRWQVEFTDGPWPDKLVSGWKKARRLGGGRAGADGALDVASEAIDAGNRLIAFVSQDFTGDAAALGLSGPSAAPRGDRAEAARSPRAGCSPVRRRPAR